MAPFRVVILRFESILQELGLVEPQEEPSRRRSLARLFHYRPPRKLDKNLDRLSGPETPQHFPGHEGEWEAFYAALWSTPWRPSRGRPVCR